MNRNRFRWLTLRQLDNKLDTARRVREVLQVPQDGWIRTVRRAIGMSAGQLAERLGVQQSTVSRLEKSERDGVVTLESLRKAADALDCDVYYLLLPRTPLEKKVTDQAARLAEDDIQRVNRTMALEDQLPADDATREQRQERHEELLRGSWRNLWKGTTDT